MTTAIAPVYRKSSRPLIVLIACFIIDCLGFTIPVTGFSVFAVPLMEALQAPAASIMLYMTLMTLTSVVIMLFGGKLIQLGAGKCMAVASALVAIGFALIATVQTLPMVYVAGVLSGLAYPMLSLFGVPVIINNWFHKNAQTWVGVTLSASGLGGLVLAPAATSMIASMGWSNAMLVLATLMVIPFLMGAIFVRLNPLDYGILPYGASEEDIKKPSDEKGQAKEGFVLPGADKKKVLGSSAFVLILVAMLFNGFLGGYATQVNTLAQTAGYAAAAAGLAVSCSSLGNLISKPVLGVIADKVGAGKASFVGFGVWVVGLCMIFLSIQINSVPLLYVSAALGGLGGGAGIAMPPMFIKDAFGVKDFSSIYGILMAVRALGTALISPVCGGIYDMTGSYSGGVIIWIVSAIIVIPCVFVGIKKGRAMWAEEEKAA